MASNAFTPTEGVPTRLVAGDFWTWRADTFATDYPSPDYELNYSLAPRAGGAQVTAWATSDAEGWLVKKTATSSAKAGFYSWVLTVTRVFDGARLVIANGTVEVAANPNTDAVATNARKQLDAIDAVLEGRITKDVESYSIEGRALTRIPFAELRIMRARLKAEVAAEDRAAAGKGSGPRYRKLRF